MPMEGINSSDNHRRRDNPLTPSRVLIIYDATRDRNKDEFRHTIHNIRMYGGIIRSGVTITVLGVLHKVLHPMGYQMQVAPDNFLGTSHIRAMEEEVSKKVDLYVGMLQYSAEECEGEGVDIEVKITAGNPMRKVSIQEVATSNATWVILDRSLRKETRFYLKHISCKVALVLDNLSLEVLRHSYTNKETEYSEEKFYTLSKPVPLPPVQENEPEQSEISESYPASVYSLETSYDMAKSSFLSSFGSNSRNHSFSSLEDIGPNHKQEEPGNHAKVDVKYKVSPLMIQKQRRKPTRQRSSDVPALCIGCGMKTELDSKKYSYSEIQLATNNFSSDNLLGEGGYGRVYKGELKDGQQIAAKVRKEASTQGFSEFHSEVYVLNFARHKNIVMLLGYCCKENLNILVYEYICNNSLDWHLFDNPNQILEWHRRHAIAIGTATGLRFLHEECRGSPIIHRDVRPSNILITHDFVPMLADFGLAKWTTNVDDIQTRILGTLGYLAPEYAENGIVSVRTDVYAFGIVLIQLISGRKAVDSTREDYQPSLRQWALSLIEKLALHELADPRLGESYNTHQLYHMARTAFLCLQTDPEMRPSMAEVLRLLEGDNNNIHRLTEQFIPHYSK
ncbi:serine/threonine-protein kinase CDG1-like [Primulina huaijiensis]|uniref:serine/threonine-protein kinase CDG1-like n=1 Tax=Primulina huaijiensis TaxID=1492673 RepID=UPI003CC6E896